MELMQPKTDDPAQQQSNIVLKVLPIMIGWFALNVPAALSVYWVVNNIVTTATSLFIRSTLKVEPVKAGGASSATMEPPPTIFTPPREKPSGFASPAPSPVSSDSVTPLTVIDAETLDEEDDDDEEDGSTAIGSGSSAPKKKRGKKGKKKKRN